MPELPDITVYVERIAERTRGKVLEAIRFASPFVLRTAVPPIRDVFGKRVTGVERLGKRIVFSFEDDFVIVVHLMVAGRFRWESRGAKIPGKLGLAAFDFETGTLILTEASSKKRASIHLVKGRDALREFDRGGLEVMDASEAAIVAALTRERHTLKRALTDPTILSGIGNAYSDEILHAAKLSPMRLTSQMTPEEWARLVLAMKKILAERTETIRAECKDSFPERVTAFREDMAVHGRYGKPCPVCGSKIQRIVYADNETNYCATCQTGGKLLADRSLSRLLKEDWPRSLEELDEKRPALAALPANPARSTKPAKKR
ncbi:MAG TPA: DNA-formamidopyrimidine glycosylase family protein [Polyangiaceae bacterium]